MTITTQTNLFDGSSTNKKSCDGINIDLNKEGITLYKGNLFNHDYLWFSSSEISRVSTTIPIIHNYALTYAISYFSYAIFSGNTPKYLEDLDKMHCYATPAISIGSTRETILYNAIDDLRITTGRREDKYNSPDFGRKTVVTPSWSSASNKSLKAFEFYLFCFDEFIPPSVVRLGKKGAIARIFWEMIEKPIAKKTDSDISYKPTHPINPFDVSGEIVAGTIVKIPPHSLYRVARISDDWIIRTGKHVVHLPHRILSKIL